MAGIKGILKADTKVYTTVYLWCLAFYLCFLGLRLVLSSGDDVIFLPAALVHLFEVLFWVIAVLGLSLSLIKIAARREVRLLVVVAAGIATVGLLEEIVGEQHPLPVEEITLPSGTRVLIADHRGYSAQLFSVWSNDKGRVWHNRTSLSGPMVRTIKDVRIRLNPDNTILGVLAGEVWIGCYKLPDLVPCPIVVKSNSSDVATYSRLYSKQVATLFE